MFTLFDCDCDSSYRNKCFVQKSTEVFTLCDCDNITNSYTVHYEQKQIAVAIRKKSYSLNESLGPIHTVRFFLIVTMILLIPTNGLYRTQRKCSHYATAKILPTSTQSIVSKNKSQSQIVQCERTLTIRGIAVGIRKKIVQCKRAFSDNTV